MSKYYRANVCDIVSLCLKGCCLFLLRLERSTPYYNSHIRPQPSPDLPYQAPCILSWVAGNSLIFDFVSLKVTAVFTKEAG